MHIKQYMCINLLIHNEFCAEKNDDHEEATAEEEEEEAEGKIIKYRKSYSLHTRTLRC